MKLVMMKGLQGSGKSTVARKYVEDNHNFVRVGKDELRRMLHNYVWNEENEEQVTRLRDYIIRDAISHGKSIVVDDTNLNPKHEAALVAIANEFYNVEFEVHYMHTPLKECIRRDRRRVNKVGEEVIMHDYKKWKVSEWLKS